MGGRLARVPGGLTELAWKCLKGLELEDLRGPVPGGLTGLARAGLLAVALGLGLALELGLGRGQGPGWELAPNRASGQESALAPGRVLGLAPGRELAPARAPERELVPALAPGRELVPALAPGREADPALGQELALGPEADLLVDLLGDPGQVSPVGRAGRNRSRGCGPPDAALPRRRRRHSRRSHGRGWGRPRQEASPGSRPAAQ